MMPPAEIVQMCTWMSSQGSEMGLQSSFPTATFTSPYTMKIKKTLHAPTPSKPTSQVSRKLSDHTKSG